MRVPLRALAAAAGLTLAAMLLLRLVAAVVRAATPQAAVVGEFPVDSVFQNKFAHLATHRDEYDVVFLGASLTTRAIVPEVLDRELATRGLGVRSYNLGAASMFYAEAYEITKALVALRPARLRWVVIDTAIKPGWDEPLYHQRYEHWYTAEHTWLMSGAVVRAPLPWYRKLTLLTAHWRAFGGRAFGLLTGRPTLRRALSLDERRPSPANIQGYHVLPAPIATKRGRQFQKELEHYRGELAALPDLAPRGAGWYENLMLGRLVALLQEHGVKPILLTFPSVQGTKRFTLPAGAALDHLTFNDPRRFATLYDPSRRIDREHLNDRGAREFSQLLAQTLPITQGAPHAR